MEDENKGRLDRVKRHLKDNKKTYLVGAGCLAGGIAVGLYFRRPIVIDFRPVITNNNLPTFNNTNLVENHLGRVSKIVRDTETGKEWTKIRHLAEEIATEHGISYDSARTRISQHLHGLSDHVFNKRYEIAGLRTDF
jgi:hypothetical protein